MQVKFYSDGGLFSLDWITFHMSFLGDGNLLETQIDVSEMIDKNHLWRDPFNGGVIAINGNQDIYNWIKDLSRIMRKLKKEKVPWKAQSPIFFHSGKDSGILALDNDGLVQLVLKKSDGTVSTDIIDLFNLNKSKLL